MMPPHADQIRQVHARLIVLVAQAALNPSLVPEVEPVLSQAERQGWTALVPRLRRVLKGERGTDLLHGLDEEDMVILRAILEGIQNPGTLPDPEKAGDPAQAAPGLARMIHAAARGDSQALHWLSQMAEQMTRAGGDMARLGGIMKRLIDGERDPDSLCRGMGAQGESLVLSLLSELGRLEHH